MRELKFIISFLEKPFSSVLVECGRTKVLTAVSVQEKVPPHVQSGFGWLTSEYSLLPSSTDTRVSRERQGVSGRTAEIQRLIGRSLRMAVDLSHIPGLTLMVDADVLQADGGTRTAAINGSMLALFLAGRKLVERGMIKRNPCVRWIGAISAGIIQGKPVVDLNYAQDSTAESDFNFVFSEDGSIVEIQGTAEKMPVSSTDFYTLLEMSREATCSIIADMKKMVV